MILLLQADKFTVLFITHWQGDKFKGDAMLPQAVSGQFQTVTAYIV